jgi:hypothetical protein
LAHLPDRLEVCRLDVDRYPRELALTVAPGRRPRVVLHEGERRWELDECPLAWFRRLGKPTLRHDLHGAHRQFALGEVEQALSGALELIHPLKWINEVNSARRAAIKLWQYECILRCGVSFAAAVVSNHAREVRSWRQELTAKSDLVYKSLHSPLITPLAERGEREWVFTTRLADEDLADEVAIAQAPCQFQVLVEPAYEVRVTTIGNNHSAVRIDHERWSRTEPHDWRAHREGVAYSPYILPEATAVELGRLMRMMGLEYGASDWIVTTEGEHVLLEVNPHGAWLWLDAYVSPPTITERIATYMLGCVS